MMRFFWLSFFVGAGSVAHGQSAPVATTPKPHFYAGLEGLTLANAATQLGSSSAHLSAGDGYYEPRPAVLVGYQLALRLGLEAGLQLLPVATGFAYAQASATNYVGFSSTYTNDYLYVPLRAVGQLLGTGHRLRLSALLGGGPAWTNLRAGLPITPNGTTYMSVTNADGSTTNASYTQQITRERTAFAVLEAGLRGSYWFGRQQKIALDLTVRQLWGLGSAVRTIALSIDAPGDQLASTLTSRVQGLAVGLGARYAFR